MYDLVTVPPPLREGGGGPLTGNQFFDRKKIRPKKIAQEIFENFLFFSKKNPKNIFGRIFFLFGLFSNQVVRGYLLALALRWGIGTL